MKNELGQFDPMGSYPRNCDGPVQVLNNDVGYDVIFPNNFLENIKFKHIHVQLTWLREL